MPRILRVDRRARAVIALVALALAGCTASPRPQAIVHVDTDLPIPLFADTLRVDHLAPAGEVLETRIDVAPHPGDWPRSFGVRDAPAGVDARFRMRLHPAHRVVGSIPGIIAEPALLDEPLPGFTIDGFFEIETPAEGVEHWLVVLPADCLGSGACAAPLPERVGGPARSRVGTWPLAREVPCAGEPRAARPGMHEDETCIEGGVFFLGDELKTIEECGPYCSFAPERLVEISPFWMDVHEVTVARWRDAVARGFVTTGEWLTALEGFECVYSLTENDELPMNCVSWQAAADFCAFDGGRLLPTEAQWEFAGSGRGEERTWPWGEVPAHCDQAVFGRFDDPSFGGTPPRGSNFECSVGTEMTPVPVDEPGLDLSRDGVAHLAGNISEWVRDAIARYDAPCWSDASRRDPFCASGASPGLYASRGTSWSGDAPGLAVISRYAVDPASLFDPEIFSAFGYGLRCVRPASP